MTLPAEAIAALNTYRREQVSWFMASGSRPATDRMIVSVKTLEPITPEELSRAWRRLVSEILGHADPGFTLRVHAHSDDERKRAAARTLGAMG